MTKIDALYNVLNNYDAMDDETRLTLEDMVSRLEREAERKAEQKAAKVNEYAEAHDVVMGVLADATGAVTVSEIYESCKDELPEGFSKNKISYALRVYWSNEVVKTEGKVNAYAKA